MEKVLLNANNSVCNSLSRVWFKGGLILAPMVRLGTTPFRLLSLKHGADVVYTEEIISFKLAKCIRQVNDKLNTIDFIQEKDNSIVLRIAPEEKGKLICQIGANDPDVALKAAEVVKNDVIGIDVNMGCPKHFSTHGNMGSNLIYMPELACSILKKLRENLDILVSCKIRIHDNIDDTLKFIKAIQDTGIDFYTVHYRTKFQDAKNKANWEMIPIIYENSKIPVFANGDIFCTDDYNKINKYCDGVMLARGAVHNPGIFNDIKQISKNTNTNSEIKEKKEEEIINNTSNNNLSLKEEEDTKSNEEQIKQIKNSILLVNEYQELEDKDEKDKEDNDDINNKNDKNNTKKIKKQDNNEVKESKNLAKIFFKKYEHNDFDVLPYVKEFIEYAEKYENAFHNTKYNASYILKTHKKHMNVFNEIQKSKTYNDLNNIF